MFGNELYICIWNAFTDFKLKNGIASIYYLTNFRSNILQLLDF